MIKASLISIATLCLLTACSIVGRDYSAPLSPEVSVDALTENNTALFTTAEPVVKCWEPLSDPQLSALMKHAFTNNLDVRVATAIVFEARAISREMGFDRFPTVETSALYTRQRLSNEGISGPVANRTANHYATGFDAVWELDLFGQVSARIDQSQAFSAAELANLQSVYVSVAAEVARTYIELRGAQYRLDIAKRNAKNQRKTYGLTQTMVDAGRSTDADLARSDTQLRLTRATTPPLQAEVTAAIRRLSVLTGQAPNALEADLRGVKPLPTVPLMIAVGNPAQLLRRRPDIRRAERELTASISGYNIAVADLFPKVTLNGSISFVATSLSSFGAGALAYAIGPTLSWAGLDIGRVRARMDTADARIQARLAVYEQTVLEALEETQNALTRFSREEERRATLQHAARSSLHAANLIRTHYQAGMDDFLDVLDAERTQLAAEDQLALSEITTALELIAIYKALGGGWQIVEPLAINSVQSKAR